MAVGIDQTVKGLFHAGDNCLLVDSRGREHLVVLQPGAEFHTHAGLITHDEILGRPSGTSFQSSLGARLTAWHPTLSQYVLNMKRGAQVIYPKDLGQILMMADVHSGARVLESGVGSGALTMALVRSVGQEGSVVGYEIREDFSQLARSNIERFLGTELPLQIECRDVYQGIDERNLDSVVLDLPEPWHVVSHAEVALHPGGTFVAYLPTIGQVGELRAAMEKSAFRLATTVEVLVRPWHVTAQSVRPDHRMVAHTGFLTSAQLAPA